MDLQEIASSFAALTNASNNEAEFYLEAANYDLDRAVEMFYGNCTRAGYMLDQSGSMFVTSASDVPETSMDCDPVRVSALLQSKPLQRCSAAQQALLFSMQLPCPNQPFHADASGKGY